MNNCSLTLISSFKIHRFGDIEIIIDGNNIIPFGVRCLVICYARWRMKRRELNGTFERWAALRKEKRTMIIIAFAKCIRAIDARDIVGAYTNGAHELVSRFGDTRTRKMNRKRSCVRVWAIVVHFEGPPSSRISRGLRT